MDASHSLFRLQSLHAKYSVCQLIIGASLCVMSPCAFAQQSQNDGVHSVKTAALTPSLSDSLEFPKALEAEDTKPQARGVVRAAQTAEIGASMSARLTKLPYKSGQAFNRGALLAQFDCSQQKAEAQALEHALGALSVKHENVKELLALGAAGTLEESMASADKSRAQADLQVAKARLKHCAIYAPYAGRVKTRHVSAYDTPSAGAPLYSIIRSGRLEIDLIAPSAWMRWMKPGKTFTFTVDETGESYSGKIVRLGAAVDPVSQTIEVTAKFSKTSRGVLPGMSGVAEFDAPEQAPQQASAR